MNKAVSYRAALNPAVASFGVSVRETPVLLCDVDGTLAETEAEGHLPAFNEAFAAHGLAWQWSLEDYRHLLRYTGGLVRMQAHARAVGRHDLAGEEGNSLLKKVHAAKNSLYERRVREAGVAPRSAVVDKLREWQALGGRWAAVTTTSRVNWSALWAHVLAPLGTPAPVFAVCGEDVHTKKPHPAAYELALRKLGISPEQAIAIEDSPNGVRSAHAAGLRCVTIPSQFFMNDAVPGASAVIRDWSDLRFG